jgi:phosphatidylglycerol:prolipoprotein diacylglycerol transferase
MSSNFINVPLAQIEPISSVALKLGPLSIHWYGLILGMAVLVALLLGIREGKKHGIPSETFLDLVLIGVPAGILGGRLYYVIFEWSYYAQNPLDIFAVWKGGLAIHGVLIASVITLIWFVKKRNLSFWRMADIAAPSIIIAQSIGRWGNFMNQEAHGGVVERGFLENLRLPEFIINQMYIYNPTPEKVEFGNLWNFLTLNPVSRKVLEANYYFHHPTYLYESIWNLIGFIILISIRKFNLRQGELFFSYLIWYSIGRFYIEGMRTDSLMLTDTLRIAQVISIVIIVAAISAIYYRRKKGSADPYYENLK